MMPAVAVWLHPVRPARLLRSQEADLLLPVPAIIRQHRVDSAPRRLYLVK